MGAGKLTRQNHRRWRKVQARAQALARQSASICYAEATNWGGGECTCRTAGYRTPLNPYQPNVPYGQGTPNIFSRIAHGPADFSVGTHSARRRRLYMQPYRRAARAGRPVTTSGVLGSLELARFDAQSRVDTYGVIERGTTFSPLTRDSLSRSHHTSRRRGRPATRAH